MTVMIGVLDVFADAWPVNYLSSPETHSINHIVPHMQYFSVDGLSDFGMINLVPLYKIPSSHVISSLKYQYDWILWEQSLIILGHLSWTVFTTSLNDGSLSVASHSSCSLSGLAVLFV